MRRRDPFPAERTFRRGVGRDIQPPKRVDRQVEPPGTRGSVDKDAGPNDRSAGGPNGVDRLLERAARRHDVVNDEHSLARRDREPAAELSARSIFPSLGVDRSQAKLPRHLMREDDPSRGRAGNGLRGERRARRP